MILKGRRHKYLEILHFHCILSLQIHKGLNWDRHQSYAITAWGLTAWIMKSPKSGITTHTKLPSSYVTKRPGITEGDKAAEMRK
jgi:hypothetical protein